MSHTPALKILKKLFLKLKDDDVDPSLEQQEGFLESERLPTMPSVEETALPSPHTWKVSDICTC